MPTATTPTPRNHTPGKRTRRHAIAELRGLGGLVLEQALLDSRARPLKSLLDWNQRLAEELGEPAPARAETYAELMSAIVTVSRGAGGGSLELRAA